MSENLFSGPVMADLFQKNMRILEAESDRGVVLVASSVIERELTNLISSFLLPHDGKSDEIFKGASAPLATLEAKILMAYRLGLIRPFIKDYLNIFRKIRNDFAHNIDTYSFSNQSVKNRLRDIYELRSDIAGLIEKYHVQASGREISDRNKFIFFFAIEMAALERARCDVERILPLE